VIGVSSGKKRSVAAAGASLATQHRHKLFRRMVSNKDKPALALASWAVILEMDHQFRRYWKGDMHGASVAGMSPFEREIIVPWCHQNGASRVTRMKTFDDFMHPSARDGILNLPDDLPDITYMENELVVIGTSGFIRALLSFIGRIPPRNHACYLRGVSQRTIRSELKHTNHRIVENLSDDGGVIVSCDDRERLFPLWLRG